jgi:hypothetical protein
MTRLWLFAATVALLSACVNVDSAALTTIDAPSETDWKPVGLFLGHRCGSLDCHGQVGRNLRIYNQYGLRLDPMDVPGGSPTTAAELEADYRSAVALEPEIMSQVVMDHGAQPDRLTLVRKPRGLTPCAPIGTTQTGPDDPTGAACGGEGENHKGGHVIQVGDDQDKCLTSWLADAVDDTACANTLNLP